MNDIYLQIDPAQQEDLEQTLKGVAGGVKKAEAAAINRTLRHVRAVSAREIKKHINLPVARIKKEIDTRKRATQADPSGTVHFSHAPVPLIDYKAKDEYPAGVSVTERLDKGRKQYRHYFFATMPNGHRGVFRRVDESAHRRSKGKWTQLPIKEVFGASVVGTFARAPGIAAGVMADSGQFLQKQLASQVDRLLHRERVDETEEDDEV